MTAIQNVTKLAVLGLATYRLTKLINEDEATRPIREAILRAQHNPKLEYLLSCSWCVSVWAGAGLVTLDKFAPNFSKSTQSVLAASAITGIIDTIL
jgi:hypothetical protein